MCIRDRCHICIAQNKDTSKICVTESPADAYITDESTDYNGYFFVLDGNFFIFSSEENICS